MTDAGAPAPATDADVPATTTTGDATPAKKPGRGDTAAQNANWEDVRTAPTDVATRKKLDIDWMPKGVLPEVLDSIDSSYSNTKHDKRRKKAVRAALSKFDKDHAPELDTTRDEIAAENGISRNKKKKYSKQDLETIENDPRYSEEKERIAELRKDSEAESGAVYDESVEVADSAQSVTRPGEATIERSGGKALARTNFMAWSTYLMGNPEKVKKHFGGIRATAGDKNMLMADGSAKRFEAAKKKFEEEHPGYTLPHPGSTQSMRDLHQKRMGIGMLGHALGLAMDFSAVENPNLKGRDTDVKGVNAYMLSRFGGGRSEMAINEDAVEQLGRDTENKKDTKGNATSANVVKQYGEIVKTSTDFQSSLSPTQMAKLREGRYAYFNSKADENSLAALKKQEKRTKDKAKRATITGQIQALETKLAPTRKLIQARLDAAFSGWTSPLDTEIKKENGTVSANISAADAYKADAKRFGKLKKTEIDTYAQLHGMGLRADFKKSKKFGSFESMIKAEMKKREKDARERATYATNSVAVKQALVDKLHDPSRVFGEGVQNPDSTWSTKKDYTDVSVMQLLEHGFVKNDSAPELAIDPATKLPIDPVTGKPTNKRKAVFNGDTFEILARYGFAPGSNFGDTMHFDDIRGYSDAVPGGRHGDNISKLKFSPEGEFIPPPKAPKKKRPQEP